jgi:GT2 family glycosyltransferase
MESPAVSGQPLSSPGAAESRAPEVSEKCPRDDSAAVVADIPIRTIKAPRNGGFAYGCSLGTAAGAAEFVLFLNPDAGIESASLSTLVSVLRADPALGSVGPRTLGDGGQLHWTQRRFPRLRTTYSQALGLQGVAPLASWAGEVIQEPAAYTRQVFGSAGVLLNEMVKIDYLYGANWSLWLDVKTLLRTVPFVLRRRGL